MFIAVGTAWSVLVAVTGRTAGPGFERFQAAVVSVLFVGSASGALLFTSGARPADGLHLLYALIALALVPLARSFPPRPNGRGSAVLLLAAFAVLGGVLYRLLTTG